MHLVHLLKLLIFFIHSFLCCLGHINYIYTLYSIYIEVYFTQRGRERGSGGRAERTGSQADSSLTAVSLMRDLNSQTVRSWPEPKPIIGRWNDWATRAPQEVLNRMAGGGLTGKVVCEKRLEGGIRVSHAMSGVKVIQTLGAWSLFPILCLPLSLPLLRSCSVSLCSCSVSLCPKNK